MHVKFGGECTKQNEDILEKVQLEAARIVTGLPKYASRESLYFETGWESLKDRRNRRKLTLFHKIFNCNVPSFLTDITFPLISTNPYNLRNESDFLIPNYRLQSPRNSYFPCTIKLWNSLEPDLRHGLTLTQFKNALRKRINNFEVPDHFYVGERKFNIILTRLRNCASNLNYDLNRVNLINSPSCLCGHPTEDVLHFLFDCSFYTIQRNELETKLTHFYPLTAEKLLFEIVVQLYKKIRQLCRPSMIT